MRTQPPHEHALAGKADLNGRDVEQLEALVWHDRMTMISQLALEVFVYCSLPGFHPDPSAPAHGRVERVIRLLANHYVLSFGMYWTHRSLHVVPALWKHIHSLHHWARHPLSRNTYQDHWLDNFGNAIIGHICAQARPSDRARTPSLAQKPPHARPISSPHPAAQILVPLDFRAFVFSRLWRILESLEKHSGVSSCKYNLAHASQRWLPYSQMPHHHDWHHEGAKACNFTFTPLGGLWDCLFGTRKAGRALIRDPPAATAYDRANAGRQRQRAHPLRSKIWSHPAMSLAPVVAVLAATAAKLCATGR